MVCTDLSKEEIIAEFDALQKMVDTYAKENPNSVMLVNVVWIGHTLYMEKGDYHEYMRDELFAKDQKTQACLENDQITKQFGVTVKGEPIQVLEYATRLARGPNTFVIKLLDSSLKEMRMLKPEHIQ